MIQTCQDSCIMHRTYSISPYRSAYNSCAHKGGAVAFLPLHVIRTSAAAWPAPYLRACLPLGGGQRGRGAVPLPDGSAGRETSPGPGCAWLALLWPWRPSFMRWIRKKTRGSRIGKDRGLSGKFNLQNEDRGC